MKELEELLQQSQQTLEAYDSQMNSETDPGNFWSDSIEKLADALKELRKGKLDTDDYQNYILKIQGTINTLRFHLEVLGVPPNAILAQLSSLEEAIHDPAGVQEALDTTIQELSKFSPGFDFYTVNRGLTGPETTEKLAHMGGIQQKITQQLSDLKAFTPAKRDEDKVSSIKEVLLKQKIWCEKAISALTIGDDSLAKILDLRKLPDNEETSALLAGMNDILSIETVEGMVDKCYEQYEKLPNEKDKFLGYVKGIRLLMIAFGHTYVSDEVMENLDFLEGRIQRDQLSKNHLWKFDRIKKEDEDHLKMIEQNAVRQNNEQVYLAGMLTKIQTALRELGSANTPTEEQIKKILETQESKLNLALQARAPAISKANLISNREGLLTIAQSEWDIVHKKIAENPGTSFKLLSRRVSKKTKQEKGVEGLEHSFLVIKGIPYAVERGKFMGEKGTFGEVRIIQMESKQNFALKIQRIRQDDEFASRQEEVKSEIEILEDVNKLIGSFSREGGAGTKEYILMPLELGADILKGFINTGRFKADPKLRFDAALGSLGAIKKLHEEYGVIHRDIKPNNFMMNETDGFVTVEVIDFGLSKKLAPEQSVGTAKGGGTYPYAAPETMGENQFSVASDVYSLGVMLKQDFSIDIPEMYAKDPRARPSIGDVIAYMKSQEQAIVATSPGVFTQSFTDWKKAQKDSAERVGSSVQVPTTSAELAQVAEEISNEAAAVIHFADTTAARTATPPAEAPLLHFSNTRIGITTTPPPSPTAAARLYTSATGDVSTTPKAGYKTSDTGKKVPPPPPPSPENKKRGPHGGGGGA